MQPGQGQTISIRPGNSRPNSRSTVEGSEWGSLPSTMKGRTEPPLREDSYPLSVQTSAFHLFKCPKVFLCSHPSLPLTDSNWVLCWELGQGRNGIPARASTLTDLRPQLTIHGDQGSGHAILSPPVSSQCPSPRKGTGPKAVPGHSTQVQCPRHDPSSTPKAINTKNRYYMISWLSENVTRNSTQWTTSFSPDSLIQYSHCSLRCIFSLPKQPEVERD